MIPNNQDKRYHDLRRHVQETMQCFLIDDPRDMGSFKIRADYILSLLKKVLPAHSDLMRRAEEKVAYIEAMRPGK